MLLNGYSNGRLELKSRLVFPPIGTHSACDDGTVSEKTLEHYTNICSASCIGLAVVEHCYVDISGKAYPNQLSIADDSAIPGLSRLAGCMKTDGTKAFLQLNHCGSLSSSKVTGIQPMSASDIAAPKSTETPRSMSVDEIHHITEAFSFAALRAKIAGFDGVEIHAAHSYLLNQFFSPLTNHRSDKYGGSAENRLRFLAEVLTGVRAAVGNSYPISIRLGACDFMPGGISFEDGVLAAEKLEALGADLLSITGGLCQFMVPELVEKRAYFEDLSRCIKQAVSIPVILTGGINNMEIADEILHSGAADLIGVGRRIFKDPSWAKSKSMPIEFVI